MVVVRLGIEAAAFPALDHDAMHIAVGHIDHQLGFAGAAAVGLVAAAFPYRLASGVLKDISAFGLLRGEEDHVELGHGNAFLERNI